MMNTLFRAMRILWALMVLVGFPCRTMLSAEETKKPAILVLNRSGAMDIDFPLIRSLNQREGLQFDYMGFEEVLTWDRLKKYNAVVVLHPLFKTPGKDKPSTEALFSLLDQFMEQGGGVLLASDVESWDEGREISEYLGLLMSRYGVSYLRKQALREKNDDAAVQFGNYFHDWAHYTENVKAHPVTQGVKGIWYPAIGKNENTNIGDRGMPSYALHAPEPWQVVVSGSATAFTTVGDVHFNDLDCPEAMSKNPCATAPPLFAVRDYKNGRMAIYVMGARFTWVAGTHRNVEGDEEAMQGGVILEKGALGKPSDFRRLLANTLVWLSAPSMESGKLGGYVQDQGRLREPVAPPSQVVTWADPMMTDWRKPATPDAFKAWRGLIGARTELSGASGTVADYVTAAKKAGLQFVVFLETFENMTPEKLARLKDQCAKNSTGEFLCIPGLYIKDNRGNHQHYFGMTIVWPDKEYLTADGRMFDVQASKTTSGLAHNSFMLAHAMDKNTLGYFGFKKSDISAMWNLKMYNSAGLVLYEGGRETEGLKENLESYLEVLNAAANIQPLAIDLVDSPAMLEAAVQEKHMLTYILAKTLKEVPEAIRYAYLWRPASFISNGPVIADWDAANRDYSGNAENFLTPNYLFPVRLHVTSEAGLREIRIWDGLKPYMRIGLNGENDFAQVLMLAHDKQKNLVLEVTDVNGGIALSGEQFDRNSMNMHMTCSDRINGLFGRGPLFFPTVTGEKGYDFVSKGMDSFSLYASPERLVHRNFESSAGTFANQRLATRPLQELVNEDLTWLSTRCSKFFPETEMLWGPWGTYGPLVDTPLYDLRIDYMAFRNHYDRADPYNPSYLGLSAKGDISPAINTYTYRFKQDQTLKSLPVAVFRFGTYSELPGNEMVLSVCQNAKSAPISDIYPQKQDALSFQRWQTLAKEKKLRIETDGFFAIHGTKPGASTVVFYNTGEIPWTVDFSDNISLMADVSGRAVKAGEEIKLTMLSVNGQLPDLTGAWRYKKLADYMGLDGPAGYPMKLTRGKQLPVTVGFCDIQADNGAVAFSMEKPKENFQLVLPVRVMGLNDKWSAVCYDKTRKQSRPIGVHQGIGYARFDPDYNKLTDVAVGHPVVADNPDVVIKVAVLGDKKYPTKKNGSYFRGGTYSVQINNPTDKDLNVTLTNNMDLPDFPFKTKTMEIKAGQILDVGEATP